MAASIWSLSSFEEPLFERCDFGISSPYLSARSTIKSLNSTLRIFIKNFNFSQLYVIVEKNGCFSQRRAGKDGIIFYRRDRLCNEKENFYGFTGKYPAGAFIESNSIYHNYFYWKENGTYDGWWGHPNHPKLNFESPELFQYIMEIEQKWVSPPFNADGWRLDVAADLGINPNFNHSSIPYVGCPYLEFDFSGDGNVLKNNGVNYATKKSHIRLKFKKDIEGAPSDNILYRNDLSGSYDNGVNKAVEKYDETRYINFNSNNEIMLT